MAKKTMQNEAREKADRLGPVNPAYLDSLTQELLTVNRQMRSLAKAMEDSGIDEVTVDGFGKFRRARKLVREFMRNTETAINKEKDSREFG